MLDAESRIRANQITAISTLSTSLNEMCGKKTRDVEKGMRQSCEAQLEEQNDELMKNFKKENERREKELNDAHADALEAHTVKLAGEKESATEDMKKG